jgi:cellulose synthase/poly-beta-1,6-N-acetylglucosamine synthase-like glycosyltransferase
VVVASDCPDNLVKRLLEYAGRERRLELVIEPQRHGKADAINQILKRGKARRLILVNSDAVPEPGATSEILSIFESDGKAGVVSATPVPEPRPGLTSALTKFMWRAHNECALVLNHMNLANHSSDEMIAFRREVVDTLPPGLVNDGAFIAARARQRGYRVRFSTKALVRVATPSRISDVVGQRRRILFGHMDVWRRTGTIPMTIESLAVLSPGKGIRILISFLARNPRSIPVLPIVTISEGIAIAMSLWDALRSNNKHVIWRRYE